VIRRFVGELGDRHDIEVWAMYHPGRDQWELDWERLDGDCELTAAAVEAAIGADPVVSQYAADITLDTEASAAIRWARAMLGPGAAVILDTETTDLHGSVCEIAVIEAATGDVLLDTLVNPETPITAGAQRIHGISDEDVAGAPTWPEVLPRLLDITQGHTVLAYNAEYDAGVIAADTRQHGLELGHLGDDDRWGCVMLRRSDWLGRYRRFALGGGHRALDDTLAALDVLRRMTAPR